jgi:hypothetical protein
VQALVLQKDGKRRVLLANLTATARLAVLPAEFVKAKVLHAGNAQEAMKDPVGWLTEPARRMTSNVALPPFAVAVVDEAAP